MVSLTSRNFLREGGQERAVWSFHNQAETQRKCEIQQVQRPKADSGLPGQGYTACSEQSQLHRVLAVGPFKELRTRNLRTASEEREVKLTPLSMDIPLHWFLETFP